MNKDEDISSFAFFTGKEIERIINARTNNLHETNQLLEAKILKWFHKSKDKDFAEYFNIIVDTKGNIL